MTKASTSYDQDFYQWTLDQAESLKKKEYAQLDLENLLEEIESLGNSEKRALESHMSNLFLHLLKRKYQPLMDSHSWKYSIRNARRQVKKTLEKNPSLKSKVREIMQDAYDSAFDIAMAQTGLPENTFPKECPFSEDDFYEEK